MSSILSLIRSDLADFTGYSSAAKEGSGFRPSIKLDANESPCPPFGTISNLCDVHRYAEPQPSALRARMSAYWNVNEKNMLLTCGSDQGIDVLIRLFCEAKKDSILICPPTFGMYEVYAKLQGAKTLSVPLLENGQLDKDAIIQTAKDNTKLIFIPAPNAPMGHMMDRDDILALCEARKDKSAIIIDEAYVEFSNNPDGFLSSIEKYPNLIILRTLSKAHALAGERVGCVIGTENVVNALSKILPPYPLAQSAVRAALDAFSPVGLAEMKSRLDMIKSEKAFVIENLKKLSDIEYIYPSETNFIFMETKNAKSLTEILRRFSIQIRDRSKEKPECVRISIGTPQENDLLLTALDVSVNRNTPSSRSASVQRKTKETNIEVFVDLDCATASQITTGLGFFDHMLNQIATHGGFHLSLKAKGDLEVDAHHTIEDCALALGEAIRKALGDKKGLARFGFTAPLDEAVANVVLDLSGRPFAQIELTGPSEPSDGMGLDLAEHFFQSLATSLGATLHITTKGKNNHHVIESSFKALGRALRQALARDGNALPSTKGVL